MPQARNILIPLLTLLLLSGCASPQGDSEIQETVPTTVSTASTATSTEATQADTQITAQGDTQTDVQVDGEVAVQSGTQADVQTDIQADVQAETQQTITTPQVETNTATVTQELITTPSQEMADDDLAIPLSGTAAVVTALMPEASGTTVYSNSQAEIDASHTADGYVMIRTLASTTATLKVIVTGPSGIPYYYNLASDGSYEVYPLSDGNGSYQFQVCKNVSGTSYAVSYSTTIQVTLASEFAPFLLPNQYVNYTADGTVVATATQLVSQYDTQLEQIAAVYSYVVENLTYDKERATTVQSGYLPDLEDVLAQKSGICFDYAALMTAMLRSQEIPCKLVIGYAGTAYHAWISTYSETQGWVDGAIYFDGTTWQLMDPTFAAGAPSVYVGEGVQYTAKYLY